MWASNGKAIWLSSEKSTLKRLRKYAKVLVPLTRKESKVIFKYSSLKGYMKKKTTSFLWTQTGSWSKEDWREIWLPYSGCGINAVQNVGRNTTTTTYCNSSRTALGKNIRWRCNVFPGGYNAELTHYENSYLFNFSVTAGGRGLSRSWTQKQIQLALELIKGRKGIKSERNRSTYISYKPDMFTNKSKMYVEVLLTSFGVLFGCCVLFLREKNIITSPSLS